jgi:hypothetical protein
MGHHPGMTSVQVDEPSLRSAARSLGQEADQMAVAHDRARTVLNGDVPRLSGAAAAQASHMLHEALDACTRLGESTRLLGDALFQAAEHTERLESLVFNCLTEAGGRS